MFDLMSSGFSASQYQEVAPAIVVTPAELQARGIVMAAVRPSRFPGRNEAILKDSTGRETSYIMGKDSKVTPGSSLMGGFKVLTLKDMTKPSSAVIYRVEELDQPVASTDSLITPF